MEDQRLVEEQFNSINKQQQVKAELSSQSVEEYVGKNAGDKRAAIKALISYIEARTPLCPYNWHLKPNKVSFLRDPLVSEDWAEHILSRVRGHTR